MKSPFYEIFLVVGEQNKNITDYVESFDYEDCLNEDDMLTLSIKSKSFDFLENKDIVVGGIILFQYGYIQGLTSALRKARITDIDTNYGDIVSVTVKAYDLGTVMKKTTEQTVWKNKKASDIATEIAKKYGLNPKVEATQRVYPSLPQGNKTDFQFLKYLASVEENGSYRFFIKDGDLIFNKLDLKKDAKRLYIYRDNSTGASVISFKPSLRESSQSSKANELKTVGFDPTKQKTVASVVNDATSKDDIRLGNSSINMYDANGNVLAGNLKDGTKVLQGKAVGGQNSSNIISTPEMSLGSVSDIANSKKKANTQKTLVGTLTIEGDPTLSSDEIITMGGVAKIHSGNWYIEKIKHTINSNGYTTVLELSKNAINAKNSDIQNNTGGVVSGLGSGVQKNDSVGGLVASKTKEIPRYDANGNRLN
ncbi:MAG: hypothetical protein MUC49_15835 [Raineya sp.]|jgi:hypothetical protein|nr:hypothetical protein [Raineya sp.]